MNVAIDWVSAVVLGIAFGISMVRAIPQHVRHWVFALACFSVAGYRLYSHRAAGLNMIFVVIAVVFGLQYAVRALRTPKNR